MVQVQKLLHISPTKRPAAKKRYCVEHCAEDIDDLALEDPLGSKFLYLTNIKKGGRVATLCQ